MLGEQNGGVAGGLAPLPHVTSEEMTCQMQLPNLIAISNKNL